MHRRFFLSFSGLLLILLAPFTSPPTSAQTQDAAKQPPLSPPATAEATIGGKKISIAYSAPSMRGRKIMGELVPFGKVWRTGANAATTLVTEADLTIGDLPVPKGTYTIFTLPGQTEWKLIINKQTGQPVTKYSELQDLGRVPLQVKQLSAPVEKFVIMLEPANGNKGVLKMMWERTELSVPITITQ